MEGKLSFDWVASLILESKKRSSEDDRFLGYLDHQKSFVARKEELGLSERCDGCGAIHDQG